MTITEYFLNKKSEHISFIKIPSVINYQKIRRNIRTQVDKSYGYSIYSKPILFSYFDSRIFIETRMFMSNLIHYFLP